MTAPAASTVEITARWADGGPLVLFDGVCNLCNGTVLFLIDHDPEARLRFASLQGECGQAVLGALGRRTDEFQSMLLVEGDRILDRSAAALRIAAHLEHPWRVVERCDVFPAVLRDAVYDLVARHRYRWFGRSETCRIPTPELQGRFLD